MEYYLRVVPQPIIHETLTWMVPCMTLEKILWLECFLEDTKSQTKLPYDRFILRFTPYLDEVLDHLVRQHKCSLDPLLEAIDCLDNALSLVIVFSMMTESQVLKWLKSLLLQVGNVSLKQFMMDRPECDLQGIVELELPKTSVAMELMDKITRDGTQNNYTYNDVLAVSLLKGIYDRDEKGCYVVFGRVMQM
jgi:hypothetical protein